MQTLYIFCVPISKWVLFVFVESLFMSPQGEIAAQLFTAILANLMLGGFHTRRLALLNVPFQVIFSLEAFTAFVALHLAY